MEQQHVATTDPIRTEKLINLISKTQLGLNVSVGREHDIQARFHKYFNDLLNSIFRSQSKGIYSLQISNAYSLL